MFKIVIGFIIAFLNLLFLFKLGSRYFNRRVGLISSFLYLISYWSFYIARLSSIYGLILLIFMLLIYFKPLKRYFILLVIGILIYEFRRGLGIFSDLYLIDSVNTIRGESLDVGLGLVSRLVENKYLFFIVEIIKRTTYCLNPIYYFTTEARFSPFLVFPPIWTGLMAPFIYGIIQVIKKLGKNSFVFLFLLIPALFSSSRMDFERLFLVSPLIFWSTAFGLVQLIRQRNRIIVKTILIGVSILVLTQIIIFIRY